ncbi:MULTISPECIES: hypothetical protein [Alphaproteobacteria]|uniref:hypothetical protein n=1 Tax=Alphaproteobacteria TaxID=28211 RepID=UPI003298D176
MSSLISSPGFARPLGADGETTFSVPDSFSCSDKVAVTVDTPDKTLFDGDRTRLQTQIGLIRAALGFECPSVNTIEISGRVRDNEVFRGKAAAADGWILQATKTRDEAALEYAQQAIKDIEAEGSSYKDADRVFKTGQAYAHYADKERSDLADSIMRATNQRVEQLLRSSFAEYETALTKRPFTIANIEVANAELDLFKSSAGTFSGYEPYIGAASSYLAKADKTRCDETLDKAGISESSAEDFVLVGNEAIPLASFVCRAADRGNQIISFDRTWSFVTYEMNFKTNGGAYQTARLRNADVLPGTEALVGYELGDSTSLNPISIEQWAAYANNLLSSKSVGKWSQQSSIDVSTAATPSMPTETQELQARTSIDFDQFTAPDLMKAFHERDTVGYVESPLNPLAYISGANEALNDESTLFLVENPKKFIRELSPNLNADIGRIISTNNRIIGQATNAGGNMMWNMLKAMGDTRRAGGSVSDEIAAINRSVYGDQPTESRSGDIYGTSLNGAKQWGRKDGRSLALLFDENPEDFRKIYQGMQHFVYEEVR